MRVWYVLITSAYSKGDSIPQVTTTTLHDEESALEALHEALDSFGVDEEEIERLLSMSLKPGKTIEWGEGNSYGNSAVVLLQVDTREKYHHKY